MNGDFRINQRGWTSSTASGTYGFDRWKQSNVGGTVTMTPQNFTVGSGPSSDHQPQRFLRIVTSGQSSTNNAIVVQGIEDVRLLAGKTVTVSFWAKSGSSTPRVAVQFEQNYGSGGSPSASTYTSVSYGSILSTSWQRFTVTLAIPSISGKTIGTTANTSYTALLLIVSNGSDGTIGIQNNTFDFWGVQVEEGSYASSFEERPLQLELAMCQRYYYRQNGTTGSSYEHFGIPGVVAVSGNANRNGWQVPVPPRRAVVSADVSSSSIDVYDGGGPYALTITNIYHIAGNTQIGFDGTFTGGSVGRPSIPLFRNTSGAFIAFNVDF
jgi:hypothetical protein